MRAYELMVIFDGDLEDADVGKWVKQTEELATGGGATLAKTDLWGKRKFAYEIDHKAEGYYLVIELTAENGAFIENLERQLRLADDVVRHKLIRLPDHEAEKRGLVAAS